MEFIYGNSIFSNNTKQTCKTNDILDSQIRKDNYSSDFIITVEIERNTKNKVYMITIIKKN